MLRNLVLLLVLSFISDYLGAQINGPSASKLTSFNVIPIPHKEAELEPTWNYMRNKGPIGTDSIMISTNLSWRLTYGIAEGTEIGLSTPSNFSSLCIGSKVRIFEQGKTALALMGGVGFNLQNGLVGPDQSLLSYYAGGLITAFQLDEKNSIDANIQAYHNVGGGPTNIFMSADWGSYVLGDKFQLILSASYNYSSLSKVVLINPGFAIESAKNFILVLNPAITVSGADPIYAPQTFALGLSYTSLWR